MKTIAIDLGSGAGEVSVCCICGVPRRTQMLYMTHGVHIQLCRIHARADYVRRAGGAVLVRRLTALWTAHGVLTTRRRAALGAHLARLRSALIGRDRPGSYAWPQLRKAAEARFAAGEDPEAVISDLRAGLSPGGAMPPAYRTMRRWFAEGRWLAPPRRTPRHPTALTLRWYETFDRPPFSLRQPIWPWMVFLRPDD